MSLAKSLVVKIVLLQLITWLSAYKLIHKLKKLPEEDMKVPEILNYHGYPCESHQVTTEDGFILTIHRIPHGRTSKNVGQYSVFLQHGIFDSSATFLMNSPKQSLGFILADAGYDVWLGNSRGNTYSRNHTKYNPDDKEFWDFSFDEMAKYDLPASINYVLHVTQKQDLFYAGHSQGTTIAFAEFSQNKEISKKIKAFFALAPVATVGSIKGAIKFLSHFSKEVEYLAKIFGLKEFLPNDYITRVIGEEVCGVFRIFEEACTNFVFLIAGFDKKELNETRIPVYLSHLPAGTSVKDVIHFAQMVKSKKFQKYDYGSSGNLQKYNQEYPPLYNISSMNVPVALYYGGEDWLADPTDVQESLLPSLPDIIDVKKMDTWNHLDFVWGIEANKHIYDDIVKQMNARKSK